MANQRSKVRPVKLPQAKPAAYEIAKAGLPRLPMMCDMVVIQIRISIKFRYAVMVWRSCVTIRTRKVPIETSHTRAAKISRQERSVVWSMGMQRQVHGRGRWRSLIEAAPLYRTTEQSFEVVL